MADIGDRPGEHRRPAAQRARRTKARRVELAVELGEFLPVPSSGECRQAAGFARLPAAEPSPGIARPRAVIDRPGRRLAEFTVIDDIDADLGLMAAHRLDGGGQPFSVSPRVIGLAGKLGAVDLDQRVGPRQAPDMRRKDPCLASLHDLHPPSASLINRKIQANTGFAPVFGPAHRSQPIVFSSQLPANSLN